MDRLREIGKQPVHLLGRFEISLPIGKKLKAGLANGALLANANQNILKRATAGVVIMNGVGCQQGDSGEAREIEKLTNVQLVVVSENATDGERQTIAQRLAKNG